MGKKFAQLMTVFVVGSGTGKRWPSILPVPRSINGVTNCGRHGTAIESTESEHLRFR